MGRPARCVALTRSPPCTLALDPFGVPQRPLQGDADAIRQRESEFRFRLGFRSLANRNLARQTLRTPLRGKLDAAGRARLGW